MSALQYSPIDPLQESVLQHVHASERLTGPFVLSSNLCLFLGCEILDYIEGLSNLVRSFSLDHVRDSLAAAIKQRLDVHVVGSQDDFEQHLLVDSHEFLIPFAHVSRGLFFLH